jgi:hypothetical protein
MTEEYIFKVSSREVKSYLPDLDQKLNIQASHAKFKSTTFYFLLQFDQKADTFLIKTIELKVGISWQDLETIAYLKGYFGFIEDREILKAIEELKNALNDKECSVAQFDAKWQEFHISLKKWFFDKIKPCLELELKLHKMYFS